MPFGRTFWTTIGNTTWFIANTTGKAIEVFKSDGTADGTVQVTHGIGVPESQFLGPFLGVVHGKLIFGGIDAGGEGVFALDTNGRAGTSRLFRGSLSHERRRSLGYALFLRPDKQQKEWCRKRRELVQLTGQPAVRGPTDCCVL